MEYKFLKVESRDRVETITVNRPEVLNALNRQTVEELRAAFERARDDQAVGAVILTGSGEKSFVAGADINELSTQDPILGREYALAGQRVFSLMETLGKPVIAAINGFCLGGGCELALGCHMRVAAETARLGQPEVKLGIIPGYGATQRLARLVGRGRALELLLTGEMISAQEAHRIGLVNRVVPLSELKSAAEALAAAMLKNAPLALRYCIEAVHHGAEMPLEEGLLLEASLFALLCTSQDMKEGTRAFLEKRAANFKGH